MESVKTHWLGFAGGAFVMRHTRATSYIGGWAAEPWKQGSWQRHPDTRCISTGGTTGLPSPAPARRPSLMTRWTGLGYP